MNIMPPHRVDPVPARPVTGSASAHDEDHLVTAAQQRDEGGHEQHRQQADDDDVEHFEHVEPAVEDVGLYDATAHARAAAIHAAQQRPVPDPNAAERPDGDDAPPHIDRVA